MQAFVATALYIRANQKGGLTPSTIQKRGLTPSAIPEEGLVGSEWLTLGGLGCFFASMKTAPSTHGRTSVEEFMHWQLRYLHTPGDRLHIATPMAFPKGAPPAVHWVSEARKMFQETWCASRDYNLFMNLFRDTVHRYGLDGALVDSVVCSPVEARHGTKALQAGKVGLFEVSVLKSSSIYVNNFSNQRRIGRRQRCGRCPR